MEYNPNRLQFVHHEECFNTAEEAKLYVTKELDKTVRPALYAEPMVLKYGDPLEPSILLAIGSLGDGVTPSVTNRTYFIDTASIEKSIEEIITRLDKDEEDIKELQKLKDVVNSIITSCGLESDGTYKSDDTDAILKNATSLKNADKLLSEYIQTLEKKYALYTKDTDTVSLSLNKEESGQTLSADVKLAQTRVFNKTEFQTILVKDEKGVFTNVDLEYDESENNLTFIVNGDSKTFDLPKERYVISGEYDTKTECIILHLNDGSKVSIDVKKLIGEWTVEGEKTNSPIVLTLTRVAYDDNVHDADEYQDVLHADVRIADDDTKPFNILKETTDGRYLYVDGTAKNIKYFTNNEVISVQEAIDNIDTNVSQAEDNLIYKKNDGLYANAELTYDSATNILTFTHSTVDGTKTSHSIVLNSASLLEDVSYDPIREVVILRFKTADGKITKVEIPVSSIIAEWEVDNTNTTVTLIKNRSVSGIDKLSANVNVANYPDNILKIDDHCLYVKGTADNIKYDEDYTVEGKIKSLTQYQEDLLPKINAISGAVSNEVTRAINSENLLSDRITNAEELAKESYNIATAEELRAQSKEMELSNAISTEQNRAEKVELILSGAIKDNSERIETIEPIVISNKEKIDSEIVRATTSETKIAEDLKDEITRAKNVEGQLSSKLETEIERATEKDDELQDEIDALSKGITNEKERAISAETALYEAIKNKTIDVTNTSTVNLNKDNGIVSANVKVSTTSNNIIVTYSDGIYAKPSKLTYDTGSNTLTFTDSLGNVEPIKLNTIDTIKNIYYDAATNSLVFVYTVGGVEKTVTIPASSFFKGIQGSDATSTHNIKVTTKLVNAESGSSATAITAHLDAHQILGSLTGGTVSLNVDDENKIYANVNVAKNVPHNILVEDNESSTHSLFVDGSARNIYCTYLDEETNVQVALGRIGTVIETLSGQSSSAVTDVTKIKEEIAELQVQVNALTELVGKLAKQVVFYDDDDNDYIKHTFSVNDDASSEHYGNTRVHVEIMEDLSRDPDSGTATDF